MIQALLRVLVISISIDPHWDVGRELDYHFPGVAVAIWLLLSRH